MIKKFLTISIVGILLSGCYMVPMALVGPGISGFSTASILQSGVTTGTNYLVKKSTGKTIAEHAIESLNKDVMQQTYFPIYEPSSSLKINTSENCKKFDFYCVRRNKKK
jgi:hypothetical protein